MTHNDGRWAARNKLLEARAKLAEEILSGKADGWLTRTETLGGAGLFAAQMDVLEFHLHTKQPIGEVPNERGLDDDRMALRLALMAEELEEVVEAAGYVQTHRGEQARFRKVREFDLAGVVDGCVDLTYVTLGTLIELGVSVGKFWAEVHRTNMAKDERHDARGKIQKPPGWRPPRIAEILQMEIRESVPWGRLSRTKWEPIRSVLLRSIPK